MFEDSGTHEAATHHHATRVVKLITTALVALTLTAGVVSVSADRAHAMNPPQTNAYYVVTLLGSGNQSASIASYWAQMFRDWGIRFVAPPVYFHGDYYGNWQTPCGHTVNLRNNGFYCPANNTVYLDYEYMQDFMGPGGQYNLGDYGVGGFLAHEFGHAVEAWLGWQVAGSFRTEYAADCIAGMYTRWAYAAGRLTGGDYWEFHNWLMSTSKSTSHGDPATRAAWYRYGYDYQNINLCALAYQAAA